MKIIVNTIEGYSSSVRVEKETLSATIEPFTEKYDVFDWHNEERSTTLYKSKKFLKKHIINASERNLFLIGKSMGGAKTYWLLRKYWNIIKQFNKIAVLFIDAHGRPIQEPVWRLVPYGRNRDIVMEQKWKDHESLYSMGIYQHNKYPYGARINGADRVIQCGNEVDHFNITDNEDTIKLITDGFEFLMGDYYK